MYEKTLFLIIVIIIRYYYLLDLNEMVIQIYIWKEGNTEKINLKYFYPIRIKVSNFHITSKNKYA